MLCSKAHVFGVADEAAEELGVTSARVRQMVLKGELAAEKFDRDLMITAEAFTKAKKRETDKGLKRGTLFVHSRHRLSLSSAHVRQDWNEQEAER